MERAVYEQMADLDQRHWWYTARRRVLAELIRREVRPPEGAKLLEIGCGTGHNLEMLGTFGSVDAVELDDEARALAERRLGKAVMRGPLPDLDGVPLNHYDVIAALDVIEHIDDDRAAIQSIARRLTPQGKLLIAVPAHPWMWSGHDVVNHHRRRYSRAALQRLIDSSPLRLDSIGYFNSLLFPLAVADRMASKLRGRDDTDLKLPPAALNTFLDRVFGFERYLVGRLPLPPGLSLFAVASAR